MFDSHCHLTDLPDPEGELLSAQREGVGVLVCGYNAASNAAVLALRERHPGLPISLGLHPWYAEEDYAPLLEQIRRERPTVLGEAGLDLYDRPPDLPLSRQIEVLEAQLDLAAELDLPVTLHSRSAVNELVAVLEGHPRVRGVLHAYAGSPEQLRTIQARFLVGLGGTLTWRNARRIHRLACRLPLERIVLETDCPAIGCDVAPAQEVRPRHTRRFAAALAELRGITLEEVEAQTDANLASLFGPGEVRR